VTENQRDAAPWIEGLARFGFAAKGLLYIIIGTLAGCAGLGLGGETTDARGAMDRVHEMPMGRAVLIAIAIGLVGYAVWRCVQGLLDADRRGSGAKAIAIRSSFVVRGLVHLWLAFSAAKAAFGSSAGGDSGQKSEQATATAFSLPKGEWIVWVVALGIAGFGLYQVFKGITAKLNRDVDQDEAEQDIGSWVLVASRVGIAARGVVFVAIGWLLIHAAQHHNPSEAGGIGDALDALARLGKWPFVAIAIGLIAYGLYQLLSARYRRIRAWG
jgi:hypothetical protein